MTAVFRKSETEKETEKERETERESVRERDEGQRDLYREDRER